MNTHSIVKIRPGTREKYEQVRRVKRLKFVEIADLAIDALIRADPEMKPSRRRRAEAATS